MACRYCSVCVHFGFLLGSLFPSMKTAHPILLILVSEMLSIGHFDFKQL